MAHCATRWLTDPRGEALKVDQSCLLDGLEFTEYAAFLALFEAFIESGESSAIEFLANGEGAFHFQDLAQNAAGEGIDLSESSALEEFQQEVIETMEKLCQE